MRETKGKRQKAKRKEKKRQKKTKAKLIALANRDRLVRDSVRLNKPSATARLNQIISVEKRTEMHTKTKYSEERTYRSWHQSQLLRDPSQVALFFFLVPFMSEMFHPFGKTADAQCLQMPGKRGVA